MKKITEEILDFKSIEKKVFNFSMQIGREALQEEFQRLDLEIMALRDTSEYRAVNSETRVIKTLMGEVPYTRRRYKKKSGGYVFLLDKVLGIDKDYGLVSENLAEQIIAECADKSFRKAAGSISNLTGQKVSAMGAWGVFQQFGERLTNQKERLAELQKGGAEGQLGNLPCQILFSEFDDVWLPMQRNKRLAKGTPGKTKRKRTGKKPIHVGTAYTGWRQSEGDKHRLENKFAYASFGTSDEFVSEFEMLLRHRFDMDGAEHWIMNGDGASWIRAAAESNDAILQLDPFHRSRAVMRAVADKRDRKALLKLVGDKDIQGALAFITELIAKATDEQSRKKLGELFTYFYSNRNSLLTWAERGIELPDPPEGIVYRNLGTQESSNCDLITQRMKHRKGSWSENGANNMAKIRCFRNTIGLDTALGILPPPPPPMDKSASLSAAKSPKYDGNGYDASWLFAKMPFDQVSCTNGRNAVRGLLKLKPLTELSFI